MKAFWVEDSLVSVIVAGMSPTKVDQPSEHFDHQSPPKEWVEPRLLSYNVPGNSRSGEETDAVTFRVKCYLKSQPKGKRRGSLAKLVDRVRALLDPTEGAKPIKVVDTEASETIAILNVIEVAVDFQWDVTETFNEGETEGLDVAELLFDGRVSAILNPGSCPP